METVAAVGLASSIITFIDFGYKIVTASFEIRETGRTSAQDLIKSLSENIDGMLGSVRAKSLGQSEDERRLNELVKTCEGISEDLKELLKNLELPPGSSFLESARTALRILRKRGKLSVLERKLHEARENIMRQFLLIIADRTLDIQIQLGALASGKASHNTEMSIQLTSALNIMAEIKDTLREHHGGLENIDDEMKLIAEAQSSVNGLLRTREPSPEIRILKQLFSKEIFRRKDSMEQACDETFSWILEKHSFDEVIEHCTDKKTEFSDGCGLGMWKFLCGPCSASYELVWWLRSGDGIFYISGKPGSGKSTLLKLLLEDERTRRELQIWAGRSHLIISYFFFWAAGTSFEKTLDGLYRSVLFQVIRQSRDHSIAARLFPEEYSLLSQTSQANFIDDTLFTNQSVEKGFENLLKMPDGDYRLFLVVDGLDEFLGGSQLVDYTNLATTIKRWGESPHVKVLCSSRPYPQFARGLHHPQQIDLHEINEQDIHKFCLKTLTQKLDDSGMKDHIKDWVEQIVSRAEGVFLWARLAVFALLNAVETGCDPEKAGKELELTPSGLNALYDKLLSQGGESKKQEALDLIQPVALAPDWYRIKGTLGGLPLVSVFFFDKLRHTRFPFQPGVDPFTLRQYLEWAQQAQRRVETLTHGLLTVGPYEPNTSAGKMWKEFDPLGLPHVEVFHRTARDFILSLTSSKAARKMYDTSFYTRLFWAVSEIEADVKGNNPAFGDCTMYGKEYMSIPLEVTEGMRLLYQERRFDMLDMCKDRIPTMILPLGGRILHWSSVGADIAGLFEEEGPCSIKNPFLQFAAFQGFSEYVLMKLKGQPDNQPPQGDRESSLLLSAATPPWNIDLKENIQLLESLLEMGADPFQPISVLTHNEPGNRPVWWLWLAYIVERLLHTLRRSYGVRNSHEDLEQIFKMLQLYLETDLDGDCLALLSTSNHDVDCDGSCGERECTSVRYAMSLRDLVIQGNPENLATLTARLDPGALETWSVPANLELLSTVPLYTESREDDLGAHGWLTVHRIRWRDGTELDCVNLWRRWFAIGSR